MGGGQYAGRGRKIKRQEGGGKIADFRHLFVTMECRSVIGLTGLKIPEFKMAWNLGYAI
jgi:hypothetical protein